MGVLIVDDDNDLRDSLRRALEGEGYDTVCAPNGREALNLLHAPESRPSLVLLDIMMPEMNGLDFLDLVERDSDLCAIPVVVMTAHARERRNQAHPSRSSGRFLRKPVNLDTLLYLVEQYCPRKLQPK